MISYEQLEGSRQRWRDRFLSAEPFPHAVIDELFEPDRLAEATRQFPDPSEMPPRPGRPGVLELSDRSQVPTLLGQVSDELLGERVVSWLAYVSGIDGLCSDPGGAWGALRQSGDGVAGKIHLAPRQHPDKNWDRQLTLILHLSEALDETSGGCFQLWDADQRAPQVTIAPVFNRAVVFRNVPTAFHGASPTTLEPGQTRKILQAPYFTPRID